MPTPSDAALPADRRTSTGHHVDALVVNYGTPELTRAAALSARAQGAHVLVCDNSGDVVDDDAFDLVVRPGRNLYFAEGNDVLLPRCEGELVLLLNPDAELRAGALDALVAALDEHPDAWGAAPRLVFPDGSPQDYFQRLPTAWAIVADRLPPLRGVLRRAYRRYHYADREYERTGWVEQPPAACLLLRRSDHPDGVFDPRYRLLVNDTDLARRLNATGRGARYAPDAVVVHHKGAALNRGLGRRFGVTLEYDAALTAYANAHLRHAWAVRAAMSLRRNVIRVAGPVLRRRGAPRG